MKFGFIGGTNRGYRLLEELLSRNFIPAFGIVTKEDVHEELQYADRISELLGSFNVPCSIKHKLSQSDYEEISIMRPDFIIVYGWRTIIDRSLIPFVKHGMIAAHQSLLPKYRGFAPVQWVIINGEKETGVTLFKIDTGGVDSGLIVAQEKVEIGPNEYSYNLDQRIIDVSINLFLKFINDVNSGTVELKEQNEEEATYTCKRIPDDGKINWHESSLKIFNLIRALATPYPGAFCYYNNQCYHIRNAVPGENNLKHYAGSIPGRVIRINSQGIEVLCGAGTIFISVWENKDSGRITCPSEEIKSLGSTLF